MKINNNISAVIANKKLLGTEGKLSISTERLSSGLKLNHASDNPSGMAMSNKMRAQIRSLEQASRNASDGISVIQIVDGALEKVTEMLQRMRELAVQAENGINSEEEREACQLEFASLRDEVDRVSKTTEYNTKSLTDGSLDARVYPDKENVNHVSRVTVSDSVAEGLYGITVEKAATQAVHNTGVTVDSLVGQTGELKINGCAVSINPSMTRDEIYTALRNTAAKAECSISGIDEELSFRSNKYGSQASLSLIQDADAGDIFGADIPNKGTDADAVPRYDYGTEAQVTLDEDSAFSAGATVSYEGNRITITDVNGFRMNIQLAAGFQKGSIVNGRAVSTGKVDLDVTQIGIMDLQINANHGSNMQVRIPSISAENLYLDDLDLNSQYGPRTALTRLDDAISQVSQIRSQIGAYENRLDYSVASLDETQENMEAALSRIEDVDMAEEMTEFTKYNVLQQAGTSVLAQANELPTLALQLLQ